MPWLQTVWLEAVPNTYITAVDILPDIDLGTVTISATSSASEAATILLFQADIVDPSTDAVISSSYGPVDAPLEILLPANYTLWSPEQPFLYDVYLALLNFTIQDLAADVDASTIPVRSPLLPDPTAEHRRLQSAARLDTVRAYTGIRKVSKCPDGLGIWRLCLNNLPTFAYGELCPIT